MIFDTIKVRKQEWPVAFELMVVLMRKVENSANELNIGNVVREVYLNSAMEEAIEAAKFYYGVFFRTLAKDFARACGRSRSTT